MAAKKKTKASSGKKLKKVSLSKVKSLEVGLGLRKSSGGSMTSIGTSSGSF
jgi:hypothetical protein